ncbi:hypothetical protein IJJ37_02170 [Candidatus Saccharibacteria bacterium]|nr:hypothetical protein [Candidatus Saccharibacteria bacterium]
MVNKGKDAPENFALAHGHCNKTKLDADLNTVFSGKNNYEYWGTVFRTGKTPDGVDVLVGPLNFQEMLK